MTNTVFGPYAKTVWTNGATPISATNMNHLETQASAALNGVNPDLLSAFILSGVTCAKDGVIANQLDIAAGRAYITLSDGTRGLIIVGADNTHTTSAISSTYHLYLQPDGTWYWSTSNSPATNSLAICTVTTDTSGNIATVTDNRILTTSMLNSATPVAVNELLLPSISTDLAPATDARILNFATTNALIYKTAQTGAAQAHSFGVWTGSALNVPFNIGQNGIGASTNIDQNGAITQLAGQATVGGFGAPMIVAQAVDIHVTSTAAQTVVSFTAPIAGLYRASLYVLISSATSPSTITAKALFTDRNGFTQTSFFTYQTLIPTNAYPNVLLNASVPTSNCIAAYPIMGYVKASGSCSVIYQNATATPNDFASAMIERLS